MGADGSAVLVMRSTVLSNPGVLVAPLTKETAREDDVETRSIGEEDVMLTVIVLVEYETPEEIDFVLSSAVTLVVTPT